MRVAFDANVGAQLTFDRDERVCGINHFGRHWTSQEKTPHDLAIRYLQAFGQLLQVPNESLSRLGDPVSDLLPLEQGVKYQVLKEKSIFDSTTVRFVQTVFGVPMWGAGITVTIKNEPYGVVSAVNTGSQEARVALPSTQTLDRYRRLFDLADESERESSRTAFVRGLVGHEKENPRLIRGRFRVYRYDPEARLPRRPDPFLALEDGDQGSAPALAPVPRSLRPGDNYLVAEVTFGYRAAGYGEVVWLALVELETGVALRVRPLAAGLNGMVFPVDPITASGDTSKTAAQSNAILNPFRKALPLSDLSPPLAGIQSLSGPRVKVTEVGIPAIPPPTAKPGADFAYDVRTNDFAAVNAYYHVDRFFREVESLGFPLRTYFNKTTFPVQVDHRDLATEKAPLGNTIDAYCVGNGTGGIGHVGYALNDLTNTAHPVGRACDSRVHWHELGGHGTLLEHVNSTNFHFAHSAGDSLSAIFHAPESKAPDPGRYAPWHPANDRRFDRKVSEGWAWGGKNDDQEYGSEEILATTLFRVYRSIGGDAGELERRRFASRMMLYLILRAIGTLTPETNPRTALEFANVLMTVDLLNWTHERVFGGAYNKVIRWSFEKQGLYQARGAPRPVATEGLPPAVDVYIDDGRSGEYQYQRDHTKTEAIWNRRAPDGVPAHQEPVIKQTNHAYVKVKNRGTQPARHVRVRGFHCRPASGLVWSRDLEPLTTPDIAVGTLGGNNADERLVGPFGWTPNLNSAGHDCLLMIVSADGDPSNADHVGPGEPVEDWRLVPNDNNIGMRKVLPKSS